MGERGGQIGGWEVVHCGAPALQCVLSLYVLMLLLFEAFFLTLEVTVGRRGRPRRCDGGGRARRGRPLKCGDGPCDSICESGPDFQQRV